MDGEYVIYVGADTFTDTTGNSNLSSNQFNWIYDGTPAVITAIDLFSDNSAVDVTIGEMVYNTPYFSGYLQASDFSYTLTGGNSILLSSTPNSISVSGNTYTLGIGLYKTPDGNELLTISPATDAIYDTVGNPANTSQVNTSVFLNDQLSPSIEKITSSTQDGSYGIGEEVNLEIFFSENVIVSGYPRIILELGESDGIAEYSHGSGDSIIVLSYNISMGDYSSDLDLVSIDALELNGGSIKDFSGNDSEIECIAPGNENSLSYNKEIIIDALSRGYWCII